MTLDFFLNNYDIEEFEIKSIIINDNKLYLKVVEHIYLELIANGYRPEMDLDKIITFIFNVNADNMEFKNIDKLIINANNIIINNVIINYTDNVIMVKEN